MQGYSCAELKEQGLTKSGIYYLLIRGTSFWYIKVYCDMEAANGGWTVRVLFSNPLSRPYKTWPTTNQVNKTTRKISENQFQKHKKIVTYTQAGIGKRLVE